MFEDCFIYLARGSGANETRLTNTIEELQWVGRTLADDLRN